MRPLYEALVDAQGSPGSILDGWLERIRERLDELAALRTREAQPLRQGDDDFEDHQERLWSLYAFSRTVDYLIERGCPATTVSEPENGESGGRGLHRRNLEEYATFLAAVGLNVMEHADGFSPFHHEIFSVVQDEDAETVALEQVLWPGFQFGDLLIARAGVRVRAPRHLLDARIVTTSTLYFTFRRAPRPVADLSHGWGSNSQWRTRLHRFYEDAQGLHLNWDGTIDIGADDPPEWGSLEAFAARPVQRRQELLLYRCFARAPLPADEHDWFPYEDRMTSTDLTHALWG
jgi:hypothetical protein